MASVPSSGKRTGINAGADANRGKNHLKRKANSKRG
jgi:hypothetical protein